jgi:hypothetical protein
MTIQFDRSGGAVTRISPPNSGSDIMSGTHAATKGEPSWRRRVMTTSLMTYFHHVLIGFGVASSILWVAALFWLALRLAGV